MIFHTRIASPTGTLLDYSITTSPAPLRASAPKANPSMGEIQIVVSNGTEDPIWCKQIQFVFQVGDLAQDYYDSTAVDGIGYAASPSDEWQLSRIAEGTFSGTPKQTQYQQITVAGLAFQIYNVAANQQVGTFVLSIEETSSKDGINFTTYTTSYKIPKFPPGFFVGNFASNVPMVPHNGQAVLTWSGSDLAKYEILYANTSHDVTNLRSWPTPNLSTDTTFILQASAQQNGETVTANQSVTIIVQNPDLNATSITAASGQINGPLTVTGLATMSTTASVTGKLTAGSIGAGPTTLDSLTMNVGAIQAQNVTVRGVLTATGFASLLQAPVALNINASYKANTDGIVIGSVSAPQDPYQSGTTIQVNLQISGGQLASAATGYSPSGSLFIAQSLVVPIPQNGTFQTVTMQTGNYPATANFWFIPLGPAGGNPLSPA
jgi:hypothetical protein